MVKFSYLHTQDPFRLGVADVTVKEVAISGERKKVVFPAYISLLSWTDDFKTTDFSPFFM